MKAIIVIGDGMADRPISELGGKTPLQVARKPSIDKLPRLGISGIMDPISPGIPAGSDTSHLAILGYDPYKYYQGRGAFEALGAGLEVGLGDISFRGNFATVDNDLVVTDRRAGRIGNSDADELAKSLDGIRLDDFPDVQVVFKHTVEHRCAIILKGPRLSRMVSDSDPEGERQKIHVVKNLDQSSEALRTSSIINELTKRFHQILENHPVNTRRRVAGLPPANAILFRGAGTVPKATPITETYNIKALVIAAGALYKGVCRAVGMDTIEVKGATGTYETDTVAKARAAVESLSKYDYILVHVKGTDNAAHDGNFKQKIAMIEKIDALIDYLLKNVDLSETFIAITADHTTSCDWKEHMGDPVPISITGPEIRVDSVERFSEVDCAQGGLGRIRGINITPILMDLIGKSKKFGE
ncbi:MAG: 2,3-bisphosphoglycerate-independent phosphoglycerate mutase [Thermoproteota archaeon]|nr:2,3-bisphosphoglycerate-independent phosphoglycerate mutase [Thermoproteota archaeon]